MCTLVTGDGEWLRRGLGFRVDIVDLADGCGLREASDRDVLRRIERRDLMTPRKQSSTALASRMTPSVTTGGGASVVRRSTTTASLGFVDPQDDYEEEEEQEGAGGRRTLRSDKGLKLDL